MPNETTAIPLAHALQRQDSCQQQQQQQQHQQHQRIGEKRDACDGAEQYRKPSKLPKPPTLDRANAIAIFAVKDFLPLQFHIDSQVLHANNDIDEIIPYEGRDWSLAPTSAFSVPAPPLENDSAPPPKTEATGLSKPLPWNMAPKRKFPVPHGGPDDDEDISLDFNNNKLNSQFAADARHDGKEEQQVQNISQLMETTRVTASQSRSKASAFAAVPNVHASMKLRPRRVTPQFGITGNATGEATGHLVDPFSKFSAFSKPTQHHSSQEPTTNCCSPNLTMMKKQFKATESAPSTVGTTGPSRHMEVDEDIDVKPTGSGMNGPDYRLQKNQATLSTHEPKPAPHSPVGAVRPKRAQKPSPGLEELPKAQSSFPLHETCPFLQASFLNLGEPTYTNLIEDDSTLVPSPRDDDFCRFMSLPLVQKDKHGLPPQA